MILHLDYETQAVVDLEDVGLWVYITHPTFKILMLAWAIDEEEPELWEPRLGPPPERLLSAMRDPSVMKSAWNSGFERNVTKLHLGIDIPIEQWLDPSTLARYASMPGGLDAVGHILDMPMSLMKDANGDKLKTLFCLPLPKKASRKKQASDENSLFDISPLQVDIPDHVFASPENYPEQWEAFGKYCKQDVRAERGIGKKLVFFTLPETERNLWILDQKINEFGIPTDRKFVDCSYKLALKDKENLVARQKELTHLDNPNSNQQFIVWAHSQGYPYNSLRKEPVQVALSDPEVNMTPLGRQVLTFRKKAAKTSYTKLKAILDSLCDDGFLRDQFLFMGSTRAGRWTGRNVQFHNMSRPIKAVEKVKNLEIARKFILNMDYEGIENTFGIDPKTKDVKKNEGTVIDVVTSCIRSAFVAPPGYRFNVCDLNAIENRVSGWVAGEDKILDVFKKRDSAGRKICPYLSFAALMYKIDYDELAHRYYDLEDPDAKEMRQMAKPAVLGAGYRLHGGEWATKPNGDRYKTGLWGYAENMGIKMSQDDANEAVRIFRQEYPKIVAFWYDCERAVIKCIKNGGKHLMGPTGLVWCERKKYGENYLLRIHLPSGRYLNYLDVGIERQEKMNRRGEIYIKEVMTYLGLDQVKRTWGTVRTHGGKLMENIVQAISRDILAHAMLLIDQIGLQIVGHVHDEIITMSLDQPEEMGLRDVRACMEQVPVWAPGLALAAEGYESTFYHK